MPIRLKRLALRNWTTIRQATLDFPERGLVLIVGKSDDNEGKKESVGAGKTAIGEAISRALLGISGRFELLKHFCHDEVNEDAYVCLDTLADQVPLRVEMGYKCRELSRTGEGLRVHYGATEIARNRVEATRQELTKLVTVPPELAEWTVFVDGQRLNFSRLSQRSSVDLLMAALQQPPWSQYHEKSRRALVKFKRDAECLVAAHAEAKLQLETCERNVSTAAREQEAAQAALARDEARYRDNLAHAENDLRGLVSQLSALDAQRQQLKAELKTAETLSAEAYKAADQARRDTALKLARARKFKQLRQARLALANNEYQKVLASLKRLKAAPTTCPKCGQPWNNQHGAGELAAETTRAEALATQIDSTKQLLDVVERDEKTYNVQLASIMTAHTPQDTEAQLHALRDRVERLEQDARDLNRALAAKEAEVQRWRQGPSTTELECKKAVHADRITAREAARTRVAEDASAVVEAQEAVKVMDYLNTAFSPIGIPNMILASSIAPLNSVSRRISNLLTDGSLTISYQTKKTLVSGEERPDLDITVSNQAGAKRVDGSSKGEAGQINLIVAETLAEVGNVASRIAYQFYDEVVNSQDPVVRQCVFRYLKEKAQRLGTLIFVVDHHQEAGQFADHVLVVHKHRDKTSTIEWSR